MKPAQLECSVCNREFDTEIAHNTCDCGGLLLVRYDLAEIGRTWTREQIRSGPDSMWRYAPVLPLKDMLIISLGEGMTPLIRAARLGPALGADRLWVKDEGRNPTGTFKARGFSCAVSKAVELGIRKAVISSEGNAAGALAAYAAAAGMEAHVFMPAGAHRANRLECQALGARVTLVEGPIGECARLAAGGAAAHGCFDFTCFREPYRIEGEKTLGYELAEQLNWDLPDAILWPAGSGAGIIGIWKAFAEMEALGWIGARRPKMIAVQAAGCQPLVRAWRDGAARSHLWEGAWTVASGLRVPEPGGGSLALDILRASGGRAVAVADEELIGAGLRLAREEGIFAAPEGAACVAALERLIREGFLTSQERIVIYNTGSGLKYPDAYATRFPQPESSEQAKLGGLITPR